MRLIEDETEVRALAFRVIASAFYLGFKPAAEKLFYVERSFADFLELLEVSVDDAGRRAEIAAAARRATERLKGALPPWSKKPMRRAEKLT